MTRFSSYKISYQPPPGVEKSSRLLIKIARPWDTTIRDELRQTAEALWPTEHFLGLLPVRRYRLRRQATSDAVIWWIEHDLPPYDRYQCATYQVHLAFEGEKLYLTIRSGRAVYPVNPLTAEILNTTLNRAGSDPPLIISRRMGLALDP